MGCTTFLIKSLAYKLSFEVFCIFVDFFHQSNKPLKVIFGAICMTVSELCFISLTGKKNQMKILACISSIFRMGGKGLARWIFFPGPCVPSWKGFFPETGPESIGKQLHNFPAPTRCCGSCLDFSGVVFYSALLRMEMSIKYHWMNYIFTDNCAQVGLHCMQIFSWTLIGPIHTKLDFWDAAVLSLEEPV